MAKQVTVIPSAQPVKVTVERPSFSNPGVRPAGTTTPFQRIQPRHGVRDVASAPPRGSVS